jgi:hypothetical protein
MKADEKIVDAATGLRKMKEATRRVLAVRKEELERREAAWKIRRAHKASSEEGHGR